MVAPRLQRRGISRLMLAAMRGNARRLGFVDLYAPLRPTEKHLEPLTPFADYVARRREDRLPYDSWIRAHVLAGARTVKVAPYSMVVSGTIAEWTAWTGLAFGESGPAIVPGAAVARPCLARTRFCGLYRAELMGTPPPRLMWALAVPGVRSKRATGCWRSRCRQKASPGSCTSAC